REWRADTTTPGIALTSRPRRRRRTARDLGQILLEEGDCSTPCEVGGFLVVACLVGVVVEGVVHVWIHEELVCLTGRLERRLVGRDAGIDSLVEPRVVQQ